MKLVRTSLRMREELKKAAESYAFREETTLQNIFNDALEYFLNTKKTRKAKKIVFRGHNFGVPLDNITRSDYYDPPRF